MALVVESFDGRVLDRPVHPLDLTVRPRMARLRETMLDVEIGAGGLEGVAAEEHLVGAHGFDLGWGPSIAGRPAGSVKCMPLSVSTVWIV